MSHTWAIGTEVQFYLLWPPILVLLLNRKVDPARFLGGAILVIWMYRGILSWNGLIKDSYAYNAFDCRADHLLIGCLVAVLLQQHRFGAVWRWMTLHYSQMVLTIVAIAGSFLITTERSDRFEAIVSFGVDPLLFTMLMIQLMVFSSAPPWRFLESRPMVQLGGLSCSVYLWQQVVVLVVPVLGIPHTHPLWLPVVTAAVLVTAAGSYYIIEKPALRLRERFRRRAALGAGV